MLDSTLAEAAHTRSVIRISPFKHRAMIYRMLNVLLNALRGYCIRGMVADWLGDLACNTIAITVVVTSITRYNYHYYNIFLTITNMSITLYCYFHSRLK